MSRQIWFAATLVVVPAMLSAQTAVSKMKDVSTATATIEAIDQTARTITLKDSDGETETVTAGPEAKRFGELKVGDTIKMRYYESVVLLINKPGAPGATSGTSEAAAYNPGTGKLPGGTLARQVKESVTVKAIDPARPSITVETPAGHVVTRKVHDAKRLSDVAVGDRIDITYTQALVLHVEPAGAQAK